MEPSGIITQFVLSVPFVTNNLSCRLVRDNERKDGENEEQQNEEEHDNKIQTEQACDSATGTHKTSDGDEKDEDAQNDDRRLQETVAIAAVLLGKPNTCSDDGDGEEEGEQVKNTQKAITQSHDGARKLHANWIQKEEKQIRDVGF